MPKNAACPKHTRPTCPTRSSSESAKIANTIILVTRSTPNLPPTSGKSARASKATANAARRAITASGRLEEAAWPPQQDERHDNVDQDAGRLGKKHLAEGIDDAHEERRGERAAHRADAADHHPHEADDEHLVAHAGFNGRAGRANTAPHHTTA